MAASQLGAAKSAVNVPDAITVEDGHLTITTCTEGGKHHTGMIESKLRKAFGYWEARIRFDDAPAVQSAFWLRTSSMGNPLGDPAKAGVEIDIVEHRATDARGKDIRGIGSINLHWDGYGAHHQHAGHETKDLHLGKGFHVYGLEWTPTAYRFFIDGHLEWEAKGPISHRPEAVILSSEVKDGGWGGRVPKEGYGTRADSKAKMLVDYVRYYEKKPGLRNPVWTSRDNLRDPAVLKTTDGYRLFYSRLSGSDWGRRESWSIAEVFTRDFARFDNDRDVSPKGYASPGDVVSWHGRYLLPYQSYPGKPTRLVMSESADLKTWSPPLSFLTEALDLPWNDARRVIDPTFVVRGDTLHCFFIGTTMKPSKANLLGHAVTRDPKLKQWSILTADAPLIGRSERAPDGVENVAVFRTGEDWTMIYSEGLANQHLALATSQDLNAWKLEGPIDLPRQAWMARKFGAPYVWKDDDGWRMILMGENAQGRTTFGLLSSPDGKKWTLLPEKD